MFELQQKIYLLRSPIAVQLYFWRITVIINVFHDEFVWHSAE